MSDRTALDAARRERGLLVQALTEAGATVNGQAAIRCPFHDDQAASGSIHEDGDGFWWYTCHGCTWNGKKKTGDVFSLVKRVRNCTFADACLHLGIPVTRPGTRKNEINKPTKNGLDRRAKTTINPATRDTFDAEAFTKSAAARLTADRKALDVLWRTRGIDAATAARLGIGITNDGRYWTFPVADPSGGIIAVKHHRMRDEITPKSLWLPNGIARKHVFPFSLDGDGPVWLCPGELKAAAICGVGLPAVGITSGEGAKGKPEGLPELLLEKLAGREVAITPDDDEIGAAWGEHVQVQLADAGIEARVVDAGQNKSAGLKDIGDIITRELVEGAKESEAVAEWLRECWRQSDPWQRFAIRSIWQRVATWEPVEHIATGLRALDDAAGGGLRTKAVHLIVGKPGRGKTQTAVQIAVNAAKAKVPTGIISLELDRDEIGRLVMAQLADIPRIWLDGGGVSGQAAERFELARNEHSGIPLTIVDDDFWPGGLDREKLAEIIGDGVKRFGWRLVVLDYLGLLARGEADRSEYDTDLLNSAALRRIARRNKIALLVVAALRKSATFKDAKNRPFTLDDVAGAGRIVYDATSVWGVEAEQPPAVMGQKPTGIIRLIPLKTRFASASATGGDVVLRWYPGTGSVVDLEGVTDDA